MLQHTRGIVLRSVKYGESSLITAIFTEHFGVQSYLVQGVRSSKSRNNKAALLQPASLLELVAYQKEQKNLQRLKEFQTAHIYASMQEEVVRNSVALFSVELLLRLLPEHAPQPELFNACFEYFIQVDRMPIDQLGNLPLWFVIYCSDALGYELKGNHSTETPHLHLQEGGYSDHPPISRPFVSEEDGKALSDLLKVDDLNEVWKVSMHASMRYRLLDWYLEFLHQHSQHLGTIKSLPVLRAILH